MASKDTKPINTGQREPFLCSWQGFKRISVFISIGLSIASLVLSSVAQLANVSTDTLRGLMVSGIIVNSVAIVLSALTSLDWRSEQMKDLQFAKKLEQLVHVHDGDQVYVLHKRKTRGSSP